MSFHQSGTTPCSGCMEKLKEAHSSFAPWFNELKLHFPDIHISWAYRDEANQDEAYKDGKSKLQWPNSPHNATPSKAIDLFEISQDHPNGKWDPIQMARINQWNHANNYTFMWGGGFRSLGDSDHFQINA